jgi:DNA mismatch repair protein MLH3
MVLVAVRLDRGIVMHHGVQKKEDCATFQSAQLKNAVRDTNFDMGATEALKDSDCFSFNTEPSLRHDSFFGGITDAFQLNNNVASIDYKLGHRQMHSPKSGSYQWLEDGTSHLEDDVSSATWKMQRAEGIFQEYACSGNFGMLEDVPTEGFLAREQVSELIGPEIEIQEPCFWAPYRPNRMTCDYVQNQTSMFTHTSDRDGFYGKFDKLIKNCLINEKTDEITQFSDGFYHDYGTTSRDFCGVLRKCSANTKLEAAHPSVEGLEADTINQMSFPDIHPVWSSDFMDRSSIKDTFHNFSHSFPLLGTPFSQARTGLKYHRRSNKSFGFSNCENINSQFGFTLDRFDNGSSIICEGNKHLDNSEYETQLFNYSNNDCCSSEQFGSEDDLTSWKSKFGARLSDDISRVKSANGCHLSVRSPKISNGCTRVQDLLYQHNSRCNQRSRLSKDSRSRSHSAPPFYRGKQKFTRLNELLRKSTKDGDKDICSNNQEGTSYNFCCPLN